MCCFCQLHLNELCICQSVYLSVGIDIEAFDLHTIVDKYCYQVPYAVPIVCTVFVFVHLSHLASVNYSIETLHSDTFVDGFSVCSPHCTLLLYIHISCVFRQNVCIEGVYRRHRFGKVCWIRSVAANSVSEGGRGA